MSTFLNLAKLGKKIYERKLAGKSLGVFKPRYPSMKNVRKNVFEPNY